MFKNPFTENAFLILKLPPTATKKDIIKQSQEMEALIDIGEIKNLTKAEVVEARRQLLISEKRVREEIFCCNVQESTNSAKLQEYIRLWAINPLIDGKIHHTKKEKGTKEEIKNDFSDFDTSNIKLDINGERFDEIDGTVDPKIFLMELSVPFIEPVDDTNSK